MCLALLPLSDQNGTAWTEARIEATVATRNQTAIKLAQPIGAHVTYLTAWAERDGTMQFRRDVYARDAAEWAHFRQATHANRARNLSKLFLVAQAISIMAMPPFSLPQSIAPESITRALRSGDVRFAF